MVNLSPISIETYRETGLASEFWIEVVEGMEFQTNKYLEENGYLSNIKDILY
ncbi:hypothetical protein [Aquibacillus rhizosphaerae]|uniref:Uncharacterized protein n=1 Tax=Aquibacillus rhizosphaerae TaxID=3051431 RepID=A0ABT7L8K5_9BACI|nr:hypothetical protein [Aquibacillus sp. LR5S19]MDL4840906.1 hypothetical protein [Aquibacillus sp. LR5S19]